MTRTEVIKRLAELGFEDALLKYLDIRDFLHYNKTPVKAITRIELADDGWEDTSIWTVHVELGDWGWVEA